jgi:lipopolysaccharide/colanic/teichoic acid biosynthesis glycosyltransferase
MVEDAEKMKKDLNHLNKLDGPIFKIESDPRITKIGKIIRKTSIDEFPQFFNVLKGDMSIVGPRPPLPGEVKQYDNWHRRKLSMRPGITCLWQINGRDNVKFNRRMELELQYIDNWSFLLDLKIFFKTIPVVLLKRGAS